MSLNADPNRVIIFDTTLRDGEQSPGASMNLDEKLRIAELLAELGVDVIEAGFPIASNGDFEAVQEVSKLVKGPVICGLARSGRPDIERAAEALAPAERRRIHTFIATSPLHMKYKLQMEPDDVHEAVIDSVSHARKFTDDVDWSPEDGSRTDPDFLCRCVEAAIRAGATCINLPDTVGYALPEEFGGLIRMLRERVPNSDKAIFSAHCHNDLGLAVANSLAAVEAGARQVECTINGLGERAGNAALEEIVMALRTRHDLMPYTTGIDTAVITRISKLVSTITGFTVQPNKAIVGANAFAHEAGIHQDGVLKQALTYEIMTPQSVGVPTSNLVLGKHSGRHALSKRYMDLGYTLDKKELDRAYMLFTKLADKKKNIYDEDLLAIIHDGIRMIPERYHLKYVHATGGNQVLASATVKLSKDNELFVDTASGCGPVEAAYRAIDRITGVPGRLLDYSVRSVSSGKDAVGEVFVHVQFEGQHFTGKAASSDLVDASARAYLNAVNKTIHARESAAARKQAKRKQPVPQA
jgi:2-isopropylmalate synthase